MALLESQLDVIQVSRSIIDTRWPKVNNNGYTATILDTCQFAGWSTTPVARGKVPAFEVWANGDEMTNAQGKSQSVQAPPGAGTECLGWVTSRILS